MTVEAQVSRRRERNARRTIRTAVQVEMLPTLKRELPVLEPMDAEQVEKTTIREQQ
ncbi:hypothetical protein [Mesorhizobium sp. LjNodule214]|uniref:hypothetical protein n=1 Tax=Mesorhizobium sp. LjNodule214 TaxID=3342252 RepID=UPI003ECCB357